MRRNQLRVSVWVRWIVGWMVSLLCGIGSVMAAESKFDLGHQVEVRVYHGSMGQKEGEAMGEAVSKEVQQRLSKCKSMTFEQYRLVGQDRQLLLKTGESIAKPFRTPGVIEVRFEARGALKNGQVVVDLELWQAGKKVLKTDATLSTKQPVYMVGPSYRGGKLIVEIVLAKKEAVETKSAS